MDQHSNLTEYLKRLVGGNGYSEFSDANAHVVSFSTILVLEDNTTIASLKVNDVEVIATANTDSRFNLAAVDLLKNTIINAPLGSCFTSITLTDGRVGVYFI